VNFRALPVGPQRKFTIQDLTPIKHERRASKPGAGATRQELSVTVLLP
jgi:hypothetical protein